MARKRNITRTDAEWRARLTPLQYGIIRRRGTERPHPEARLESAPGIYRCLACRNPLFANDAGVDDQSGWPAFTAPLDKTCLRTREDHSWLRRRMEVLCARCDAHLGHLEHPDAGGTGSTGKAVYRVKSTALKFEPAKV